MSAAPNVLDLVEIAELQAIADAAEKWVLSPADGYKTERRRDLERLVRRRFLERRARERVGLATLRRSGASPEGPRSGPSRRAA